MELKAAIVALQRFKERSELRITSGSQYLVYGMAKWLDEWKGNGWRKTNNKPVENEDLWRRLSALGLYHRVEWVWVKAHNGDRFNELANRLAKEAAERAAQGDV